MTKDEIAPLHRTLLAMTTLGAIIAAPTIDNVFCWGLIYQTRKWVSWIENVKIS